MSGRGMDQERPGIKSRPAGRAEKEDMMSGSRKRADNAPWASLALRSPCLNMSLRPDLEVWDEDRIIEAKRRNEGGEALSAEWFPTELYAWEDAPWYRPEKLGDIFFADAYWVVSEKAASVLRQFDLGHGALYPVTIYQKNRKTPVDHQYYCINFGHVKKALLPELSPGVRPRRGRGLEGQYWPKGKVENGDIVVSCAALEGADLWIDPQLKGAFFLSHALGRALKAAKASKNFALYKCRLVAGEED